MHEDLGTRVSRNNVAPSKGVVRFYRSLRLCQTACFDGAAALYWLPDFNAEALKKRQARIVEDAAFWYNLVGGAAAQIIVID